MKKNQAFLSKKKTFWTPNEVLSQCELRLLLRRFGLLSLENLEYTTPIEEEEEREERRKQLLLLRLTTREPEETSQFWWQC